MMMKKTILGAICGSLCLASCGQDDGAHTSFPSVATELGLYPEPPSLWLGGDDPYYSSGYTGDVMPYFDQGKFHLFFLHDAKNKPAGEGFHDIHEFETDNLTDFAYNGRMIPYGLQNEPDFGVGTGSVIKIGSEYFFYYTGHNGNSAWTGLNPRESVLLAKSTDLKNWTKDQEFIITAPAGYNNYEFRDPHVFFNEEESLYWMLVSTQASPDNRAVVLKFTSSDPASGNWTPAGSIYTSGPSENYLMLECVDVFQMGNYWYLTFSENWSNHKGTHYRIGTSPNGPWTRPVNDMLDGEFFYAAKTASDGNNRYLFAWSARRNPEQDSGNKEWAGNLVTHQLVQQPDGTLGVSVPQNVAASFSNPEQIAIDAQLGAVVTEGNSVILNAASSPAMALFPKLTKSNLIETQLTLNNNAAAGFVFAAENMSESYTKVVFEPQQGRIAAYNVAGESVVETTRVPFAFTQGETLNITIVSENSICVVYVNGKVALTNRMYKARNQKWGFWSESGSATFSLPTVAVP